MLERSLCLTLPSHQQSEQLTMSTKDHSSYVSLLGGSEPPVVHMRLPWILRHVSLVVQASGTVFKLCGISPRAAVELQRLPLQVPCRVLPLWAYFWDWSSFVAPPPFFYILTHLSLKWVPDGL